MALREVMGAAVGAVAVWLAWQIVAQPIAERAPPSIALRIAPTSPSVLSRAADAELKAGRAENAAALSEAALKTAPFTLRSLRVLAEVYESRGDLARADQLMTLAGNWSLRETEAHAWLMENRLRRGDYASSFAHAETLLRRRAEIGDQVMTFFKAAYVHDPRARAPIVALVAKKPIWRPRLVDSFVLDAEGLGALLSMAQPLESLNAPFTDAELTVIYNHAAVQESVATIRGFRVATGRPRNAVGVVDGGFTGRGGLGPLGWRLNSQGGSIAAFEGDGDAGHLLVDFDGQATAPLAEQLLLLPPGAYDLSYDMPGDRTEVPLTWIVTCFENGAVLFNESQNGLFATDGSSLARFVVPGGCEAQWLRLTPLETGRGRAGVARYDNLNLRPAA